MPGYSVDRTAGVLEQAIPRSMRLPRRPFEPTWASSRSLPPPVKKAQGILSKQPFVDRGITALESPDQLAAVAGQRS